MTRPDEDGRFTRLLVEADFEPLPLPLTRIEAPADGSALDRAVRRLVRGGVDSDGFDVLILTSRRAVGPVVKRLAALGCRLPDECPEIEVWVVGEATAAAASTAGLPVHRMPSSFRAEGILEEAARWRNPEGLRILLPRSAKGREVLPRGLRERGARVTVVPAYRTEPDPRQAARLAEHVRRGTVDAVPLTAGSAAEALGAAWFGSAAADRHERSRTEPWPDTVPVVAIGPVTGDRARGLGLPVRAVASPHTLRALVHTIGTVT